MKIITTILSIFLVFTFLILPVKSSFAGADSNVINFETDIPGRQLHAFYDLRERETFLQVTNTDGINPYFVHVQVFTVNALCNENDFFDVYTPNDTHVYNMRDILTNDGNEAGFTLPDGSYGIVVFSALDSIDGDQVGNTFLIGNMRVQDNRGYEYRTNMSTPSNNLDPGDPDNDFLTFNFSGDIAFSDIVGLTLDNAGPNQDGVLPDDIDDAVVSAFVDIYNLNEVPFSCRTVAFACIDENSPRIEDVLDDLGDTVNIVNFEYGINEVVPHSQGGPILCPFNTITDGFVRFEFDDEDLNNGGRFILFVGLNNGNGRGTLDTHWRQNGAENN